MNNIGHPNRLLIFIVAYHAQSTLRNVLERIPDDLSEKYEVEILVIDDASLDKTFEIGQEIKSKNNIKYPLRILANPENQGYGGNQKIGYHYAMMNNFDYVALLHGDGQYAPELLGSLVDTLVSENAGAVFGSRMMTTGGAIRGGMPLYKYVGNKMLTWMENKLLNTNLSEFHSGYRIYSVNALRKIPFDLNTKDFHFDTEIIIQLVRAGLRIVESPIPTYYGDEICRVNGIKYAWNVLKSVVKSRVMDMGFFYDRRFDSAPAESHCHYSLKATYQSPHAEVLKRIPAGSKVLDLGSAGGYMGELLTEHAGCAVTCVDCCPLHSAVNVHNFIQHDLNNGLPSMDVSQFDYILLLDVIEHLTNPEKFIESLREALKYKPAVKIFVSSGNVGYFIIRAMLLIGQFNYGKRGILDITHTRLFTFNSLRRLFEQGGFKIISKAGIPAPFPLALGNSYISRFLLNLNVLLVKVNKGLFSYQMFFEIGVEPSLEYLLSSARKETKKRENIQDINEPPKQLQSK